MLFDRYLIREISASFLAVAIVLTVIFLAYSLTEFLTDAASGLLNATEVAKLTFYKSVIALEVLLPLAFYFGLIVGFGRLNVHNELVAMHASGLKPARLRRPLLVLGALLSTLVGSFSFSVRPWAYSELFSLRDEASAASELDRIKARQFYLYDNDERTVYVEHVAREGGDLGGVFIRTRSGSELEIISAHRGRLEAFVTPVLHRLTLTDASIFRNVDDATDFYGKFESLVLTLDARRAVDYEYRTKAEATTALLLSRDPSDRAELQWRLSTPISTILLTVAALLLVRSRPRQGRFAHVPLAIAVYAVYYNLLGVGRTWVEQQQFASMWWVPALFALILAVTAVVQHRRLGAL